MDVEKCINKKCINYDKDDHNNCMTELNITICPNHLMEKTEPVAEVPCSDVLCGTPANDIIRIQEAMGLMNSMIYSGEQHTQQSQKMFHEAMEILRNAA